MCNYNYQAWEVGSNTASPALQLETDQSNAESFGDIDNRVQLGGDNVGNANT